MFHLHGWAEVLTTTSGDEEDEHLVDVAKWFSLATTEAGLEGRVEVLGLGGSFIVRANLVQNRERGDYGRICQLLEGLGRRAIGTYGLFFVHDDDEAGAGFRRIVIRRGLLEFDEDDLLSPIVPRLEDP